METTVIMAGIIMEVTRGAKAVMVVVIMAADIREEAIMVEVIMVEVMAADIRVEVDIMAVAAAGGIEESSMDQAAEIAASSEASIHVFTNERAHIVNCVRRWGGATSDAVLDPAIEYYQASGISGFIGYRRAFNCAVVFGDPVCAAEDKLLLAEAFHQHAKSLNWSIVYVGASHVFAERAIGSLCGALVEFGEELVFDPSCDPRKRTGTNGSLVRRKVKRAIREGVSVHEYLENDLALERAIEEIGVIWLSARKGLQIHISNVHLFSDRQGKRWFYAKQGEKIIGSISLNRLQAHDGWLINHLMAIPDAPHGTSEHLLTSVLEILDREGCRYASVGMISAKQLGQIVGLGRFSTVFARFAFAFARRIFDLDGLNTFWKKFHPNTQPSLLLFSSSKVGIREMLGISRAMNGPI